MFILLSTCIRCFKVFFKQALVQFYCNRQILSKNLTKLDLSFFLGVPNEQLKCKLAPNDGFILQANPEKKQNSDRKKGVSI